jgi:DNA repair protein RadA/Sms
LTPDLAYVCTRCRREYSGFRLSCPDCGAWMSVQQTDSRDDPTRPIPLPQVASSDVPRTTSGIRQVDQLLGGGFVPGSSILLIGPPGAGKSTLVMQILHRSGATSLYVTGEESVQQLKLRADRLGINSSSISLLFETNVGRIKSHIQKTPVRLLVIDSIQTIYSELSDSLPGSAAQIRKCAYLLRRIAQQLGIVLLLVGQVTKEKGAAGPKLLEHAVDVVLSLAPGQASNRILHASKNRFGSTRCDCVLAMSQSGFAFLR